MKSLEDICKITVRFRKKPPVFYDASVVCYNAKYTYVATAS